MAERERGLPADKFDKFDFPPDEMLAGNSTKKLTSYLDSIVEKAEKAERAKRGQRKAVAVSVASNTPDPAPAPVATPPQPITPLRAPRSWRAKNQFTSASTIQRQERPARITLNLAGETKQSLAFILSHFQKYGPDGKAYASEVLGGLVDGLAASIRELDLRGLPPHGAWGTLAASEYREQVRDRIMHAIARHLAQTDGEL